MPPRLAYTPDMLATPIARLRTIGLIESLSWFVLLFIAMPVKYIPAMGGSEALVQIVGPIHGGLWCLYILAIVLATRSPGLPKNIIWLALACTFLPFPVPLLILDPKLKAHEQSLAEDASEGDPPAEEPAKEAPPPGFSRINRQPDQPADPGKDRVTYDPSNN